VGSNPLPQGFRDVRFTHAGAVAAQYRAALLEEEDRLRANEHIFLLLVQQVSQVLLLSQPLLADH
jgi:hypothetical protein